MSNFQLALQTNSVLETIGTLELWLPSKTAELLTSASEHISTASG